MPRFRRQFRSRRDGRPINRGLMFWLGLAFIVAGLVVLVVAIFKVIGLLLRGAAGALAALLVLLPFVGTADAVPARAKSGLSSVRSK